MRLRSPKITKISSEIAKIKFVRLKLISLQRKFANYPPKGNGSVKWLGNAASGQKKNNVDKIDRKKYLSILTRKEINEIESLLTLEMNYLGYKLTSKPSDQFIYPLSRMKNFFRKIKHDITDKRLAKAL